MRISRRTSGGRGEYEISELSSDGLSPHDLTEQRLILDLGGGLLLDTGTVLKHAEGKFRIRILPSDERPRRVHLHRQLVAALLLPNSIRANHTMGGGKPIVQKGRYAVETIALSSVIRRHGEAILSVSEILLANADHSAEELHFHQRVSNLIRLWDQRQHLPDAIRDLLAEHEAMVRAGQPLAKTAEDIVASIQSALSDQAVDLGIAYNEYTDPLFPLLEIIERHVAEPSVRVEDIDPDETDLRKRTVREWRRWASHRGNESAKFRARVREAYNSTCVVCGKHYPPTQHNRVPGVDAAHILPWADYDLDQPDNGLCLCKLCHWAFDEGIIAIEFRDDEYSVIIPQSAEDAITSESPDFSLDVFRGLLGTIPADRLPSVQANWPNPRYLEELHRALSE